MTTQDIDVLIAKRDRIAVRYAYRTHQLDQIDRKLSQVPEGVDNRVDLALGRPCAQLPHLAECSISAAQAEQYRLECDGQPDGIVDHSDAQAGAWA